MWKWAPQPDLEFCNRGPIHLQPYLVLYKSVFFFFLLLLLLFLLLLSPVLSLLLFCHLPLSSSLFSFLFSFFLSPLFSSLFSLLTPFFSLKARGPPKARGLRLSLISLLVDRAQPCLPGVQSQ